MNKPVKYAVAVIAGIAAIGAVAVVALPILSRSMSLDPAASLRQVVPTVFDAPNAQSTATATPSTSWSLDSSSTVGYRLSSSAGSVLASGHTSRLSGIMTWSGAQITDAEFMVDLASLISDDTKHAEVLKALVSSSDGNSTASFVLTRPVELTAGTGAGTATGTYPAQSVAVVGALTVRGVTNTVQAVMSMTVAAGTVTMTGSIPVDLASFGIPLPDAVDSAGGHSASIDVKLEAAPGH